MWRLICMLVAHGIGHLRIVDTVPPWNNLTPADFIADRRFLLLLADSKAPRPKAQLDMTRIHGLAVSSGGIGVSE